MRKVDEKEANRKTIFGGHQRAGGRSTDLRGGKGCSGRGDATGGLRKVLGVDQGGNLPSRQSSMGGPRSEKFAQRVREGISDLAGTPSIHSQEMGRGGKKAGARGMKTLVLANQKGGVGKTATVVHLAFDFFERGLRVVVIDLDTQANASYTLRAYVTGVRASSLFVSEMPNVLPHGQNIALIQSDAGLANMEKLSIAEAATFFRKAIGALDEQGFDVCLIDTAPSLGVGMAAALASADYVLSPVELEAYSIQGIQRMVTTISNLRKANPKLQFLGMLPSKFDARNPRHGRHLDELNKAYPQLIIPIEIGLRGSIAEALASSVPVWEIKKTAARKAAKEVRALAAHICEKMEIEK